jgi:GDP-4-dehydro-6-deoxy-D-mannose reductase
VRILVTGATGFVGRWLGQELDDAGHELIPSPSSHVLSVTDRGALSRFVEQTRPDAIAHLAGVSYAGDAARDPERAIAVNAGGTAAVIDSAGRTGIPVLVTGSSEVYGSPDPSDLPLREDAPLRATQPYGRSKIAQEAVALEHAASTGMAVAVTRSFNHTGPGQRPEFVAPALANRVLQARASGDARVRVGNLDVQRDIGDVRDVVRAYRLLLEGLAQGTIPSGTIVNVATQQATSIRKLLDLIATEAGFAVTPDVDPDLVRADDPPLIVGDASRLHDLTGWSPRISLRETVADLVADLARRR